MANPFHDPASATVQNLEAAFAGESMAHIKYRYFAKLCREMGDEETASAMTAIGVVTRAMMAQGQSVSGSLSTGSPRAAPSPRRSDTRCSSR